MYPRVIQFTNLFPTIGIVLFWILFIYASTFYPGGSQADLESIGYDWVHNYWCNLLRENGMNGAPNPARPIALTAMSILCAAMTAFFFQFAKQFAKNAYWKKAILFGGVPSMFFAMLIFTQYHDVMIIVSSSFGLLAAIGIVTEVYRSNLSSYKKTGAICVLLLLLNNFIYYSDMGIQYLPLLQKVSLFVVLLWISGLSLRMIEMKDRMGTEYKKGS